LRHVESVVSVSSVDELLIPVIAEMNLVVAIAPVDVLVCILITVAAVDDVGITPEVLVEGVCAVLEVAKQVFIFTVV